MTDNEVTRILERELQSINAFQSIKGMKKYTYAYAKRMNYEQLALNTLTVGSDEHRLYNVSDRSNVHNMTYSLNHFTDGLIPLLDYAVKKYTYKHKRWASQKRRYEGYWAPHNNLSIENRDIINYKRNWVHENPITSYANYFFLNNHNSMVWYDNQDMKIKRINLVTGELPFLKDLPDKKESLDLVLKIGNVDVRKNIMKQLPFDYMKYAQVTEKKDQYELLMIKAPIAGNLPRVYLKMINPSTGETHVEAVHPRCASVKDAINFRRYGTITPDASQLGLNQVLDWSPTQLS